MCLLSITAVCAASAVEQAATPPETSEATEILRKADAARGNRAGVAWQVTIDSGSSSQTLDVKARGFDVLTETIAPAKHKGDKLLMRDGSMWFYKPDLSKPAPISQRQKLMGEASYGDVAATNYAEDYEPSALPDETVDGELCQVYDLQARSKKATYDRIKYWVSKERGVGVKAEYFTVSGKKFKSSTMTYDNTVEDEDGEPQIFISEMTIKDEVTKGNQTTMTFSDPTLEEIPARIFDVNLLMR